MLPSIRMVPDPIFLTMSQSLPLPEISLLFDGEIRAMHEFNADLGARADTYDRQKRGELLESLIASLGTAPLSAPTKTVAKPLPGPEQARAPEDSLDQKLASILAQPEHPLHKVFRTLYASSSKIYQLQHSHGAYLRRGLLSNLTTTFEIHLARLCREYYRRYPGALKADERSLSLAEVRACGTIESAERLVVEREIEALLLRPFDEILDSVFRRFSISPKLLDQQRATLEELFLRRNLFVHNLGVVNRRYLSKAPAQLFPEGLPQEGVTLPLDTAYLAEAINTVLVAGIILLQAAWDKWEPAERDLATALLLHHTYESLCDGQNRVVVALSQYAYQLKGLPDDRRKLVLINQAIALRELSDSTALSEVLSQADWSSAGLRFQMAVAVLTGRFSTALDLAKKALTVHELSSDDLRRWPLFKPLRGMPEFEALINGLSGAG